MEMNLFKWVGGKKWLAPELQLLAEEKIKNNNNIDTYIEPFAGGLGSFFSVFDMLLKYDIKTFVLNDINKALITTYKIVKKNPQKLHSALFRLEKEFFRTVPKSFYSLDPKKDKEKIKEVMVKANEFFLENRKRFNEIKEKNTIEVAALFFFLSYHSFNGLFRENNKGEYNTPFNWEAKQKNKETIKNTLNKYSEIFNKHNIIFENKDVFSLLKKYNGNNAMFYFDPPYANEKEPETKYNKKHFTNKEQKKLLRKCEKIDHYILSNHNLSLFKDFVKNKGLNSKVVYRNNIMTAKKENRGNKIEEILLWN